MRKIISLICFLLPTLVFASPNLKPEIRPDAPDHHVVVKGDTLWDITGKFFSKPWKWPYVWGMNKDHIKNPHWIYPGDIIFLDRATGTLGFKKPSNASPNSGTERLSPQVRSEPSERDAVPSIPSKVLAPFLSQPLAVDESTLANAPVILGARERKVMLSTGDTGFVKGINNPQQVKWQAFRAGQKLIDPNTQELLGIEAVYLGEVDLTKHDDVSTIQVKKSVLEIYPEDRLIEQAKEMQGAYLPRAPENDIKGQVISIYGGVTQGGQSSIVTINRGEREGVQVGHVLAMSRKGEVVKYNKKNLTLPDEDYGMLFIFRVFNKVSYGLVMQTTLPVQVLDSVKNP